MLKFLSSVLKFLASIQLAIFLIASIAGMSVVATIVSNEEVYTSVPFLGLVAAFALNLTLCTIKMLPKLQHTWKRTAGDIGANHSGYSLYRSESGTTALEVLQETLSNGRYKISEVTENGQTKLLAVKGKLSLPAPHLLHIAILVVLAGSYMTSFSQTGGVFAYVGQSSPMTTTIRQMIGDGSAERPVEGESSAGDDYITVRDFQTIYDDKGAVDNWVTHFDMVIDGEQVVTNGETRVNFPYQYDNILVYQNSYGYQYLVEIQGGSDAGTYSLPSGQHYPFGDGHKELMLMDLGDGRTLLKVFDISNGEKEEEVLIGQVVNVGDLVEIAPGVTIEYLAPNPYTVLEIKVSFGTPVVFAGFILAAIASLLFAAGRYREIRILTTEDPREIHVLLICKNKMILEQMENALQENLTREAS